MSREMTKERRDARSGICLLQQATTFLQIIAWEPTKLHQTVRPSLSPAYSFIYNFRLYTHVNKFTLNSLQIAVYHEFIDLWHLSPRVTWGEGEDELFSVTRNVTTCPVQSAYLGTVNHAPHRERGEEIQFTFISRHLYCVKRNNGISTTCRDITYSISHVMPVEVFA